MKLSQLFTKTSKDAPGDEVAKNAQLLIRAGFVYKVMAGVYAYTPLGLRVLENIKQVVREEMASVGGQELIMSSLQRRETWETTSRWDERVVDIWFKTHLQDGTEIGLAWTHEEPIIEMLKGYVSSYKDLPIYVHQFQTKLRNEVRAKSGIMRGREFVMNDMYSCNVDAAAHDAFYTTAMQAYTRVYERLGLGDDTYITFASGGAFTQYSHEFQTICDAGEDYIFVVPSTNQAFNAEVAPVKSAPVQQTSEVKELALLEDETIVGVEALISKLNIPITSSTKTMFYDSNKGMLAAVVRSDYKINEEKLKAAADVDWLSLANEEQVQRLTHAGLGYAGLYNLPADVTLFVDESCEELVNFETGANKTGIHAYNVNWERDVARPAAFYDIKIAKVGDLFPDTEEPYTVHKTAEVGNIFDFGTKKSEEMDFSFVDAAGEKQYVHLGSYGIGITRVMGVLVEKFADDKGIVWPSNTAPAQVYLVSIGDVNEQAAALYERLQAAGIETLWDDRDERPGTKFADADLMGIPMRVVISPKTLEQGKVECKQRTSDESTLLTEAELIAQLTA